MVLRTPTKNEEIRENILDCFIILVVLLFRASSSIVMTVLALGFAQQHSGEPHQWFLHLTALMLFFCPWGSPVRQRMKNIIQGYIARGRARRMEEEGVPYWVEITIKIEKRHFITDLILLLGTVYINGILGIIYGWKTPFIMVYNFFWLIRDTVRLLNS